MKRAIFILTLGLCLLLSDGAHAQRALPAMRGLEIRGGIYYYKFLADPSRTFFFYLGGSALAGYESVNRGERRLYDGSTLRHRDRFLYGGAVTLEVDAYLTDRIILSLTGRERILWGTTTGHFHAQFGLGVKFIIH